MSTENLNQIPEASTFVAPQHVQPTAQKTAVKKPRKSRKSSETVAKTASPADIVRGTEMPTISIRAAKAPAQVEESVTGQVSESIQRVGSGVKNISVGAVLSFLSNMPQFFDPVMFVIAHLGTLSKAALHTLSPLVLAFYVAQTSPVLQESLFSTDFMAMKVVGAFSLYVMSSFTWMMGWLFMQAVASGISHQLENFEKVGQKQTVRR